MRLLHNKGYVILVLTKAEEHTINVGETITVMVEGQSYEVSLAAISDETTPKASVAVDGETKTIKGGETKVIAYYFYTNFRCKSCLTIEKYTKEAIEENFEDELSSGKLVFKTINIEEEDNKHFVDDYQLYTKSVVLSLVKDGEEIRFKNLKKVWESLRSKDDFFKYIIFNYYLYFFIINIYL